MFYIYIEPGNFKPAQQNMAEDRKKFLSENLCKWDGIFSSSKNRSLISPRV